MKKKLINLGIIFFVFLFLISFPWNLFFDNSTILLICQISCRALFIIFLFIFGIKEGLLKVIPINLKILLVFLPLLIIIPNNMYFLLIEKSPVEFHYSIDFLLEIILMLVVAVSEELFFRKAILDNISIENKLLKIVISAGIFALAHIVNFFSSFNPIDLLIIVYTFGLGLVLGFMYEYTKCAVATFVFHFLFNIVNTTIFNNIYLGDRNLTFYLVSISVAIISGIYLLLIYLFKLKQIENN